jgi:hypothetical protein
MNRLLQILTPLIAILVIKFCLWIGIIDEKDKLKIIEVNIPEFINNVGNYEGNDKLSKQLISIKNNQKKVLEVLPKNQKFVIDNEIFELKVIDNKYKLTKIEKKEEEKNILKEITGNNKVKWIYYISIFSFIISFFFYKSKMGILSSFIFFGTLSIIYTFLTYSIVYDLQWTNWNGAFLLFGINYIIKIVYWLFLPK